MSSLSCTLIPRDDKDRDGAWKYDRAVEVEILQGKNGKRRWRLISNSSDGRYQFFSPNGRWVFRSEDNAVYLVSDPPSSVVEAILYDISNDPFKIVTCGTSLFGNAEGSRIDQFMYYRLDFLCV